MEKKSETRLRDTLEKGIQHYCYGHTAESIACFERIVQLDPRVRPFLNLAVKKLYGSVKPEHLDEQKAILRELTVLAQKGDKIAAYYFGLFNFLAQRYHDAFGWFRQAAELGDANAQYYLGVCYAREKGVAQNFGMAAKCFNDAGKQGHAQAVLYLSLLCMDDEQIAKNYGRWLHELAEKEEDGALHARFYLGFCYFVGKGFDIAGKRIVQNYELAAKAFYALWTRGHVAAQYYLAMSLYQNYNIVESDVFDFDQFPTYSPEKHGTGRRDKAYFLVEKFLRFAAEQSMHAQFALAACLVQGVGGVQDIPQAYHWFQRAAEQGHELAQKYVDLFRPEYEAQFVQMTAPLDSEAYKQLDSKLLKVKYDFLEYSLDLPKLIATQRERHIEVNLGRMFAFENHTQAASVSVIHTGLNMAPPVPEAKTNPEVPVEKKNETVKQRTVLPETKAAVKQEVNMQDDKSDKVIPQSSITSDQSKKPDSPPQKSKRQLKKENLVEAKQKSLKMVSIATSGSVATSASAEQVIVIDKAGEEAFKQGVLLHSKNKDEEALACFKQAAEKQYPPAYLVLKGWYGETTKDEKTEALITKWAEQVNVSEADKAHTYYCLGLYYEHRKKPSRRLAFESYQKAVIADPAHAEAHYRLGLCHEEGRYVPKNRTEALKHYTKAVEHGHELARAPLQALEARAKKKTEDKAQALLNAQLVKKETVLPFSSMSEPESPSAEQTSSDTTPILNAMQSEEPESIQLESKVVEEKRESKHKKPKKPKVDGAVIQAYEEGKKARHLAQYSKALEKFKEAADALPGHLLAALFYGVSLKEAGFGIEEAEVYFEKVRAHEKWFLRKLDSKDAEDLFLLGCYFEHVSEAGKPSEYYIKAAEKGHPEAQKYLGKIHLIQGEHDLAADWFKEVANQQLKTTGEVEAEVNYLLGICCLRGWRDSEGQYTAFDCFKKAAEKDHALAQLELGLLYQEKGTEKDLKEAFENFKSSAEKGCANACFCLAHCYLLGQGVGVDYIKAERWATAAAEGGQSEGLSLLETIKREKEKNSVTSVRFKAESQTPDDKASTSSIVKSSSQSTTFEISVAQPPEATVEVPKKIKKSKSAVSNQATQLFEEGLKAKALSEVTTSRMKFEKAANAGHLLAGLYYGMMLKEADPTSQKAKECFEKVRWTEAKTPWFFKQLKNAPNRMFRAGLYLEHVAEDIKKAFEYYESAAQAGDIEAVEYLVSNPLYPKAVPLAHKFLDESKGTPSMFYSLGDYYLRGKAGVTKDDIKAFSCFKEAAAAGHILARYELGLFYWKMGLQASDTQETNEYFAKAFDQYELAAKGGCLNATCKLAQCYWNGWGVKQSEEDAIVRATAAADQNHSEGKALLATYKIGLKNRQKQKEDQKFNSLKNKKDSLTKFNERFMQGNPSPLPISNESSSSTTSSEAKQSATAEIAGEKLFHEGLKALELAREKLAFDFFMKAAEAGFPLANLYLGVMYKNGDCVTKNTETAGIYFAKVRETQREEKWFSHPDRKLWFGLYTEHVDGQPKSAIEIYDSVSKNDPSEEIRARALLYLSNYYLDPRFGNNAAMGYQLRKTAGEFGNLLAQCYTGMSAAGAYIIASQLKHNPAGLPSLYKDTECLKKAADQGNVEAQYRWAEFLYKLEGRKRPKAQKYGEVVKYLKLAIEYEHTDAEYLLGKCYYDGTPVKDNKEAVRLLTLAAKKGHANAEYLYGKCHYEGSIVPKNLKDAEEWLSKAVLHGNIEARDLLRKIKEQKQENAGATEDKRAERKLPQSSSNKTKVRSSTMELPGFGTLTHSVIDLRKEWGPSPFTDNVQLLMDQINQAMKNKKGDGAETHERILNLLNSTAAQPKKVETPKAENRQVPKKELGQEWGPGMFPNVGANASVGVKISGSEKMAAEIQEACDTQLDSGSVSSSSSASSTTTQSQSGDSATTYGTFSK